MNPIVEFKNVSKTFYTKNGPFQALNQINLAIQEGDIFGIIGLSGAGKVRLSGVSIIWKYRQREKYALQDAILGR